MAIPDTIELEIVKGLCSADCPMCPIGETRWDRDIMNQETFTRIVDSFGSELSQIRKFILVGIGESLLDRHPMTVLTRPGVSHCFSVYIHFQCECDNLHHHQVKS